MYNTPILVTGLSGMIGSSISEHLHDSYTFEDISTDSGIDIRDRDALVDLIRTSKASIVIHLAAKADVDTCEKDASADIKRLQELNIFHEEQLNRQRRINISAIDWRQWRDVDTAFAINTIGSYNIASICKELNKKLIYMSTDFVFDGKNADAYLEEDMPNPINHYGKTKYWGELVVATIMQDYVIARTAFPYGTFHETKKDFVRMIRDRLEDHKQVSGITDQIFTPTYAGDIAAAIGHLIDHSVSGNIFHIVGSEPLSPYDAVLAIAKQFGYDTHMIHQTTSAEFYKDHAPRPQTLAISNEKIVKRGVGMKSFTEGLSLINNG